MKKRRKGLLRLPDPYPRFYAELARVIPDARIYCDPFRTLAYGTDASFYRLVPRIVAKVATPAEITHALKVSHRLKIPVTFRAAGTSLSGQAVTDSVLLLLAGSWKRHEIRDGGERITLEPGVIGAEANRFLLPYGRKIGPDPASINHCMIGGIAANNASGMCCGTTENSYRTVESMNIIFSDGTLLDTADPASRRAFSESHRGLIEEIVRIREDIRGDEALRQRIVRKFRIKNTTGYSLNSFTDYADPIDILLHLMVGSEGTLGFLSEITYRTVAEHPHKATALIFFPDIRNACLATIRLKEGPVSAVELMDRASLRSVENTEGMPPFLKSLPAEAAALLVETRAGDAATLSRQIGEATGLLEGIPTLFPVSFTTVQQEFESLWNVRKGLFPAVGADRRIGTTVVIEDVVFPIEPLADATLDLESLMKKHGYEKGIIFGHALDGNLHFVFTQDFRDPDELTRYRSLMDDVCDMVVKKYDGSLKGEHGTGRNMAPFVEKEWGEKAYSLMRRIKKAFDPDDLLSPGVIINENPHVHLENLKPLPQAHEIIDKCIECGFCEVMCPSKDLSTTPRQRIVIQREIARLRAAGENDPMRRELESDYRYLGDRTCATDGLCATTCPVSIDTGEHTRILRSEGKSRLGAFAARWAAGHYPAVAAGVRGTLSALDLARRAFGEPLLGAISRGVRSVSGGRVPLWNPEMPRALFDGTFRDRDRGSGKKVVYFPSCIVRTMGPARADEDQRPVFEAMISLLDKAGFDVLFPKKLESLCCGMPFGSKGFFEEAERKRRELEEALLACSEGGTYPVLFDTSPCLLTMRKGQDSRLRLFDSSEFISSFLLDALRFAKRPGTIAVHVTCSSRKMGLADRIVSLARLCADEVVVPMRVECCGMAGDRGLLHPELRESALSDLKQSLPPDCLAGYSNSRMCEMGLSLQGGIPYQSIVYLVDRCTGRIS